MISSFVLDAVFLLSRGRAASAWRKFAAPLSAAQEIVPKCDRKNSRPTPRDRRARLFGRLH
jgi:hypothetical protein